MNKTGNAFIKLLKATGILIGAGFSVVILAALAPWVITLMTGVLLMAGYYGMQILICIALVAIGLALIRTAVKMARK